jgi:hypothetical protein
VEHDTDPRPDHSALDELNGTLRRAVEAVRAARPPVEARDRALRRARRIGAQLGFGWARRQALFALGALAAVLLLSVALWPERFMPTALQPGERPRSIVVQELPKPAEPELDKVERELAPAPAAKDKEALQPESADRLESGSGLMKRPAATMAQPRDQRGGQSKGEGKSDNKPQQRLEESFRRAAERPDEGAEKKVLRLHTEPAPAPMPAKPAAPGSFGGGSFQGGSFGGGGLGTAGGFGGGMPMGGAGGRPAPQGRGMPGMPGVPRGTPGRAGVSNGPGGPGMPAAAPSSRALTDRAAPADAKKDDGGRQFHLDREASGNLRSRASGDDAGKGGGEKEERDKDGKGKQSKDLKAQVWHQNQQPPNFARVSVGDGNAALELVSLQVTVTIEGPRARTVVDHIFRNPFGQQLEGTFEYPLPSGASPSYFAMFVGQGRDVLASRFAAPRTASAGLPEQMRDHLKPDELAKHVSRADWGTLHEARVVSRQKAVEAYEDTVRVNVDPGLLEFAGGNTFSGRVFPIPANGYNRVLIAYEELLPLAQGREYYSFPLPNRELAAMQFSLQANTAECKDIVFEPKDAQKREGAGQVLYQRTWQKAKPEGAIQFSFRPPDPEVQAVSGRHGENGPHYVYARIQPQLKVERAKPFADHAVFLLDTSLSEDPAGFATNMKLLRKILEGDADIKQFNILTFNVGAAWLEPDGWLPNTPQGRAQAFARLDGLVLEGATDLSAALDALTKRRGLPDGSPLDVFLLSDGQITWGDSDVVSLVGRFEAQCPYVTHFHCYRTGVSAENLELFDALTRRGGGIYNCFTDDGVTAAAGAHRTQCLQVERVHFVGGPAASDVLVAGRRAAVYPGGEMIVAARFPRSGRATLLVEGTFLGRKTALEYPLEIRDKGDLAGRGWAEIAVAGLLALHDSKLDGLVTAYCQEFGIASRVASFLILENANEYKRLNLEEERGKTVHGDLGQYLEDLWQALGKAMPPKEAFRQFLAQVDPRIQAVQGPNGAHVRQLLDVLSDKDFELPRAELRGVLLHKADVPPNYLIERTRDPRQADTYLREARRRTEAGDADGAVRVLSSIIEEYPLRGDALRLVGYRLVDLKQPAQAARLFQQVERSRPFEPHSYRDLARSLEDSGNFGLAALQYELVLAGTWHNRFHASLKEVAQEEYVHLLHEAINRKAVRPEVANVFGERLEFMTRNRPKSDLRVTISWNTDATDVDLWVIEPDGTKCFYQQNRTKNGGELSQDQTQGYGPERYQIANAPKGEYTIIVHYFAANRNLIGGETHVNVVVTRKAGTPQETTERHTVILKRQNDQVEVCRVKF